MYIRSYAYQGYDLKKLFDFYHDVNKVWRRSQTKQVEGMSFQVNLCAV